MKGLLLVLTAIFLMGGYLLLQPAELPLQTAETSVPLTREFARFIDQRPDLMQAAANPGDPSLIKKPLNEKEVGAKAEALQQEKVLVTQLFEEFRPKERSENPAWRKNIELLFETAQTTHSKESLDLLREEIETAQAYPEASQNTRDQIVVWWSRFRTLEREINSLPPK